MVLTFVRNVALISEEGYWLPIFWMLSESLISVQLPPGLHPVKLKVSPDITIFEVPVLPGGEVDDPNGVRISYASK